MSTFKQQNLTNPQLYPSNQSMWAKRRGCDAQLNITLCGRALRSAFFSVYNEIIK